MPHPKGTEVFTSGMRQINLESSGRSAGLVSGKDFVSIVSNQEATLDLSIGESDGRGYQVSWSDSLGSLEAKLTPSGRFVNHGIPADEENFTRRGSGHGLERQKAELRGRVFNQRGSRGGWTKKAPRMWDAEREIKCRNPAVVPFGASMAGKQEPIRLRAAYAGAYGGGRRRRGRGRLGLGRRSRVRERRRFVRLGLKTQSRRRPIH